MINLGNYKLVLLRVKATAWLTLPVFFFLLILHFSSEPLALDIIFSLTLFFYCLGLTATFFNGSYYLGYLRAPYIGLYILYGFFVMVNLYWLATIGFDIDKNGSFTISDVLPSLGHIIFSVGFFVAETSPNLVSSISHFLESNTQAGTALLAGMIQGLFFAFVYGVRSFCLCLSKKYATQEEELSKGSEFGLLLAIFVSFVIFTVTFNQIGGSNDSEIVEATKEKTTLEDQAVDSTYSVYVGQAGIYQSPFVMYLKNISGSYKGQYIYTRHQKWINLSGEENNKGYVELNESYQGTPTGKILFKPNDLELNGEGFWGDDAEGENFNAKLVDKVNEIRQYPKDGRYIRNHSISTFNGKIFEKSNTSDELTIQHFSEKGFTFYLYEITDNGHYGTLTGEAIYDGDKAYFVTDSGCELTFSVNEIAQTAVYHAKALHEDSGACYDDFGGARNGLTHNKLIKVE